MQIIIDADPIVYSAGFAAETHSYALVIQWPDGEMEQKYFAPLPNKTAGDQMKEFFKENDSAEIIDREKIVECEPLEFALRGVKMTIQACINDAKRELVKALPEAINSHPAVTVLLSGPGNFRDDIATIKPYKGNRDPAHKPVYYQQIRDYLCDWWGAKVIEGHEADDECSIIAHQSREAGSEDYVVCTIDKDLDQIPGYHYDYMKKVFYEVTEEEGNFLFWKQVLCGDSTDNIQGLYRVGDKAAINYLNTVIDASYGQLSLDNEDLWNKTVSLYKINIADYPNKYPEDMTAEEAALENARLVKMQEYRGQLWSPPGIPDEETT